MSRKNEISKKTRSSEFFKTATILLELFGSFDGVCLSAMGVGAYIHIYNTVIQRYSDVFIAGSQ